MSKKIKSVEVLGELIVSGVVNTNGNGSIKSKKDGKMVNNVVVPKKHVVDIKKYKDSEGNEREKKIVVDYSSGNFLRWAMFKDYMPHQPRADKMNDLYPQLMGHFVGLLRGGMLTYKKDKKEMSSVRQSCFYIEDAETINSTGLTLETRRNSADNLDQAAKDNSGKGKNNTFYYVETAPKRRQLLRAILDTRLLQFINMEGQQAAVKKNQAKELLTHLNNTNKSMGDGENLSIKKYLKEGDVFPIPKDGILLNQTLMKNIIKKWLELLSDISVYKATSSLEADKESISVSFLLDDGSKETLSLKDAINFLNNQEVEVSVVFKEEK